jgi:hypothetical protein
VDKRILSMNRTMALREELIEDALNHIEVDIIDWKRFYQLCRMLRERHGDSWASRFHARYSDDRERLTQMEKEAQRLDGRTMYHICGQELRAEHYEHMANPPERVYVFRVDGNVVVECPACQMPITPETVLETRPAADDIETEYAGFSFAEAEVVKRDYVCAVCHGELAMFPVEGEPLVLLVCPKHGNVESVGRVTRNGVSIELEQERQRYGEVVSNLPDLFPGLQPERQTVEQNLKELGYS